MLAATFSDGLAVSAIVLSMVAIGFEVAFFIVQTRQLYANEREQGQYLGQMRHLLGKIEGLTTGTRDQLQLQFDRVLSAALGPRGLDLPIDEKASPSLAPTDDVSLISWKRQRLESLLTSSEDQQILRRALERRGD